MNYVIAVIQPKQLDAVREALIAAGAPGMTVSDAQGCGRQKGHAEVYRGAEYKVSFIRKVKVEIAVPAALWKSRGGDYRRGEDGQSRRRQDLRLRPERNGPHPHRRTR